MTIATTLRALTPDRVRQVLRAEGLAIDLRQPQEYLAAHIPGSIPLLYEAGPGLGGRARDLLPLDSRLVLLEDATTPLDNAADAFMGKGYEVVGYLPGGVTAWPVPLGGTPVIALANTPPDLGLLDVADPGTQVSAGTVQRIPAERLWTQAGTLDRDVALGVLAGWGIRAAAAIGILEHLGFTALTYVRTRDAGERPMTAGPNVFRAGGPA
jgi:rhodanese-related sulfurtransferase